MIHNDIGTIDSLFNLPPMAGSLAKFDVSRENL